MHKRTNEQTSSERSHVMPSVLAEIHFDSQAHQSVPIGSMYGIFTYIWLIFMVNVGIYTIHGSYGVLFRPFLWYHALFLSDLSFLHNNS